MSTTEQTPIAALLLSRLTAVTFAATMLVPSRATPESICRHSLVSNVQLHDRDQLLYVAAPENLFSTAVLSSPQSTPVASSNAATRIRTLTGVPIAMLSTASKVSRQAFYDWLENKPIGSDRAARLAQLERTFESLVTLVGSGEALKTWLQRDSEFGIPLQLLRSGRDDLVVGLATMRQSTSIQTRRGRISQPSRLRPVNRAHREAAYSQYTIVATEEHFPASEPIEAGDVLGIVRVE